MQELLDLNNVEQDRLYKRLTHHANCKMRRLTWRGAYIARGGSVPKAYEAADFVNDAIQKALDGDRNWNRQAYPTLEGFLQSIIDSDINHMAESVDNAKVRRESYSAGEGTPSGLCEILGRESEPIRILIDEECRKQFHQAAIQALKDDPFLAKLLECLEAEITEPLEIAELLAITVDEVNNAKKRLRRKLNELNCPVTPLQKRR